MKKLVSFGYVFAFALVAQANEWYVEPVIGNDAYDGTSSNVVSDTKGPFRTLQGAMTNAQLKAYDTVWLLPGTYAEGEMEWSGTNRCVITTDGLKIRSTGGKDVTIVKGVLTTGSYTKPTSGGVRCFAVNSAMASNVVIEGITMQDCDASYSFYGGGIYEGKGKNNPTHSACWAIDCAFKNGKGGRGGGMSGGNALRCLFDGCYAYSRAGSFNQGGLMINSIVVGSKTQTAVDLSSTAVNCTFHKCAGAGVFGYTTYVYNSIMVGNASRGDGNSPKTSSACYATNCVYGSGIFTNSAGKVTAGNCLSGVSVAQLNYFSTGDRDYRMGAGSPAVGFGDAALLASYADKVPEGYSVYVDYYGDAIPTEGPINAGCSQYVLPRSIIVGEGGGISVEGAPEGTNFVLEASVATVTATDADRRPFLGFEVNGVLQPYTGDSVVVEVSAASGALTSVKAIYTNTWYVDCANGDDAKRGVSLAEAKATIRAATTNALSGDVIYVAPGVYGEAEGAQVASNAKIGNRVLLPAGVTLESLEGAERTFIVGAADPEADHSLYGAGSNAVRCVHATGSGTHIRGFTITGGRTFATGDAVNSYGAAVYSSSQNAYVEDCIVSNNFGNYGTLNLCRVIRCRVIGNRSVMAKDADNVTASAGNTCYWYGCIIADNYGKAAVYLPKRVESCTIKQASSGSTQILWGVKNKDTVPIYNSVLLSGSTYCLYSATNCMFRTDASTIVTAYAADCYHSVLTNAANMTVNADFRPVFGSYAGIDAGDTKYCSSTILGDKDLYGNPRVMNGQIDIGAVEHDWRPAYGETLGRKITVTAASPEVVKTGDTLVIPSGGLSGTIGKTGPCTIGFTITGTGTLRAYIGGALKGEYRQGATTAALGDVTAGTAFELAYEPGEDDTGGAAISNLAVQTGLLLLVW